MELNKKDDLLKLYVKLRKLWLRKQFEIIMHAYRVKGFEKINVDVNRVEIEAIKEVMQRVWELLKPE